MGTTLTGSSVASTYDALLKITDNGPVGGSLKTVTDGLGNDSALQVSTAGVKSTGTLEVTGASTLTGAVTASGGVTGNLTGNVTGNVNGQVGNVTPAAGAFTTLSASGLITATGGQIKFPATDVPSADANTLDDYEEGNWTPSLGGSTTYTAQVGRYTKIGRMVYITGVIQVNSIGTGSTYSISGLPFTASAAFYEWPGSVSTWTSAASNFVFVGFRVLGGTTTGEMTCASLAQSSCNTATAVFTSGTYVYFSAAYSV